MGEVGEVGGTDGAAVRAEKAAAIRQNPEGASASLMGTQSNPKVSQAAEAQVATALRHAIGPKSFPAPRGCIGGSDGAAGVPKGRAAAQKPTTINTTTTA